MTTAINNFQGDKVPSDGCPSSASGAPLYNELAVTGGMLGMSLLLSLLFGAIALALLVPSLVLFGECLAAVVSPKASTFPDQPQTDRPSLQVAVLIPAHNEAMGIGQTLATIQPQLQPRDRLVVVADNCSDETAAVAQAAGAIVVERTNPDLRGKGYALDYGLNFLDSEPPDIVIIVDADCWVEPRAIDHLRQMVSDRQKPAQAVYLMETPPRPTPKSAISTLAFLVKNWVRPLGLARLGLPMMLTGTGMAFPWAVIRSAPLASGNIVEDMQLGIDLAIAGHPPYLCPGAWVTGRLPQQDAAAKSQRTRWEHGHLQTLKSQGPRLFAEGIRRGRGDLLAMGLDLLVPPLSLLVMIWLGTTIAAFAATFFGSSFLPVWMLLAEGALIIIAISLAWSRFGRDRVPATTLLAAPLYILWKIPLYLAFLVKPQTKWVRTARDPDEGKQPKG